MVVWKYELDVRQNQMVQMPIDAQILSLGVQNDFPVIWALTSGEETKSEPRIFSVVTTGECFDVPGYVTTVPAVLPHGFVGTVTLGELGGWYVAHVFESQLLIKDNKLSDRVQIATELKDK